MDVSALFTIFNWVLAAFVLWGLWCGIQTLRGTMTWGQARCMGMTASLFVWTQVVFYLAAADTALVTVAFFLDWPLWATFLLSVPIWVLVLAIYWKLCHRESFKPVLFSSLVLIPLGMPLAGAGSRLVKEGGLTVSKEVGPLRLATANTTVEAKISNYRRMYKQTHPMLPESYEVHHSLPQKYEAKLSGEKGVNIHDVGNLRGMSQQTHREVHRDWSQWERDLNREPSCDEIIRFRDQIDQRYGMRFHKEQ